MFRSASVSPAIRQQMLRRVQWALIKKMSEGWLHQTGLMQNMAKVLKH